MLIMRSMAATALINACANHHLSTLPLIDCEFPRVPFNLSTTARSKSSPSGHLPLLTPPTLVTNRAVPSDGRGL